ATPHASGGRGSGRTRPERRRAGLAGERLVVRPEGARKAVDETSLALVYGLRPQRAETGQRCERDKPLGGGIHMLASRRALEQLRQLSDVTQIFQVLDHFDDGLGLRRRQWPRGDGRAVDELGVPLPRVHWVGRIAERYLALGLVHLSV